MASVTTVEPETPSYHFSQREFRNALGLFPTGVTVITARAPDGELLGITVSSFNSVSLEPPLVLFSVARSSHSLRPLETSGRYAVNLLRQGQSELSNRFARAHEKSWDGLGYREGTGGTPMLDGAAAVFQCVPHATYDGGDHVIFVGRVESFHTRGASEPLVFYNGAYRELRGPMENMQHFDALMLHGW
jgi:flavin reductase (DIM6/NTAB) family NADH-FMN oxidoreductase RutF